MASRIFLFGASPFRSPALVGSSIGLVGATIYNRFYLHNREISNNTAAATATLRNAEPIQIQQPAITATRPGPRGLQRVLNYQHLTIGSMLGLMSGFVVGKLSKVLVMLVVAGCLTTQFLISRGITILPQGTASYLGNTVVQWGREKVTLKTLLTEDPSFKVSFLSAFVVAAIYA